MVYKWQQRRLLVRLGVIRTRYIRHRNFLLFISFIVGLLSGLAAVLLKLSVQFFEHRASRLNDSMGSNWLTAVFPLIGTGISLLLLTKVFKGRLQRGVGFIIEGIFTHQGRIHRRHILGQIFTSAITVALGGSVGLEAPIVATGASLGSNTAHDMRLHYKDATLLLACGIASGIAAVFNSPIAGIIFTLEVLLLDFNIPFFIPLLISTATSTVLSQVLYPEKFFFTNISGWNVKAIPFYLLLGIGCGFVSVYVSWLVEKVEHFFAKKGLNWKSWLIGGLPLCLLIFLLPVLYGEGYRTIIDLLHGRYQTLTAHSFLQGMQPSVAIIMMCLLLIGLKGLTATLTTGAGGNGGIFAPSLIIGGLTGFLFAYVVNLTGILPLNTANFIITAMAGVLAGVMHAPLTAIFLLAEITGGYVLFVPLMIVVALSYFITRKYVKHSVYHKSLAERHIIEKRLDDHF
jgi:chloride channel protein, CIC family